MSKGIIDISVPLGSRIPLWPGSAGARISQTLRLDRGASANVTRLDCDIHAGTHVEAPWHCLRNGRRIDQFPVDAFIGHARVWECRAPRLIAGVDLEAARLPRGLKRLLIKTANSRLWKSGVFRKDYAALSSSAARWLVRRGIRLVGIDYLSIEQFHTNPAVHKILMKAGVLILEGLDLSGVRPGDYELICPPIRLVGAEGAPVRALLRPFSANGRRRP